MNNILIEDVQACEWFELAPYDKNILENGLSVIGLNANVTTDPSEELSDLAKNTEVKSGKGFLSNLFSNPGSSTIVDSVGKVLYNETKELKEYNEIEFKKGIIDCIKEKLGLLTFETVNEVLVDVKIPLFRFNSPIIEGSEIIYESTSSETANSVFGLTIFGVGLGRTHKLKFSSSNSFLCSNGSFKQVYIPLKLKTSLINVISKDKLFKNQFVQTELIFEHNNRLLDIGIEELTEENFYRNISQEEEFKNYFLSADKSKSIHTFQETYGKVEDYEYSLGISAFNLDSTCKTLISRNNEVVLKFRLPAGEDYCVNKFMGGLGLHWIKK